MLMGNAAYTGRPPVGSPGLLSQEASPYSCLYGYGSARPGSAGLLEQTGRINNSGEIVKRAWGRRNGLLGLVEYEKSTNGVGAIGAVVCGEMWCRVGLCPCEWVLRDPRG